MIDFAKARRYMVDCQVRPFDVTDHAVLAAMDEVERERFAPAAAREIVYLDRALDVGGRVLLTPMVLSRLLQALTLGKSDRVIDLACGLGYSTALLARLAGSVVGVEENPELAKEAASRLAAAGVHNATARVGSFSKPLDDGEPVNAMLVNGAVEVIPEGWTSALVEGGRIACVHVRDRGPRAVLLTRIDGRLAERVLFDAAAPLLTAARREPAFSF